MAKDRRGFLAGLLLGLVPIAAAQATPAQDLLVQAQYREGPPYRERQSRRRRRRCWIERRRVIAQDRFGRTQRRIVEREVCR